MQKGGSGGSRPFGACDWSGKTIGVQDPGLDRSHRGGPGALPLRIRGGIDLEFHRLADRQVLKLMIGHRTMVKKDVFPLLRRDETESLFLDELLDLTHRHCSHSFTHLNKLPMVWCVQDQSHRRCCTAPISTTQPGSRRDNPGRGKSGNESCMQNGSPEALATGTPWTAF